MKISILCENASSDVGCLAEWGFSTYIAFEDKNILFDTGYSDVYLHNAKQLDLDLNAADYVVFSHYHSDHTRGMKFNTFQSKKKAVFHPDVLEKLPEEEASLLKNYFELFLSKEPLEFEPNIFFLGEIPRQTPFEKGTFNEDDMRDDSALALKTEKGVVVIAGCSHAGICNICEHAKQVTKLPLYAVIGGFHLFEKDQEAIEGTLNYFEKEAPVHLYPMHCVDFPTLAKFHQRFNTKKYAAGDVITL